MWNSGVKFHTRTQVLETHESTWCTCIVIKVKINSVSSSCSLHCSSEVVVSDAAVHGRWGVQGSPRSDRMELQHRQQSQDHKGLCAHFTRPLLPCHPFNTYMHAHTARPTTEWSIFTSITLDCILFSLLFSLICLHPALLSPFTQYHFFFTQFLSLYFSSGLVLALTSNILWRKIRPTRTRQIKHTRTLNMNITIPFTLTCPASLRLTGMPSDSMQKELATGVVNALERFLCSHSSTAQFVQCVHVHMLSFMYWQSVCVFACVWKGVNARYISSCSAYVCTCWLLFSGLTWAGS